MGSTLLSLLALSGLSYAGLIQPSCKCIPGDSCWPSSATWDSLNTTVSGKLILDTPPAISCYPGPYEDAEQCAYVNDQWSNSTFRALSPVGYVYPTTDSCLPVAEGATAGNCTLGQAPLYTVNATEVEEVAAGIIFAQENNVRLVVRNTGHDILGKSEGYGAVQVWIKYLKKGITYQETYQPSDGCASTNWTGAAFTVAGGYTWGEVYNEVFGRNMVIVGGGDRSVGAIGGYPQGGGHSPASRDYGLGADQILEAQVVLADGSIVTANACQNSDLYFAIRGGGGGTYGVVTSITFKAYPTTPVVAQLLTISPIDSDLDALLEAITDIYEEYPALSDAGYSGYGSWAVNSPTVLFGTSRVGYVHTIATMDKSLSASKTAFAPLLSKLQQYNGTSLNVNVEYYQFSSYADYYDAMCGVQQNAGSSNSALTSRMFSKSSLTASRAKLRDMIGAIAGATQEYTINNIEMVGGGKVLTDGSDPYSGVNPAWRATYIVQVVARGWAATSSATVAQSVKDDITYIKGGAMRALTPFLGSYMNEADRNDPLWASDFFGINYMRLALIKKKYDPKGLFYCPKCVGSMFYYQKNMDGEDYGALCSLL